MADTVVPAHMSIDSEVTVRGLPVATATVTVSGEAAELPLPGGPEGDVGPRGKPRATFIKMGTLANQAARPSGLGALDRGKWWHRLDSNGMDVWTGTEWKHSPDAVGVTGPVAFGNQLSVAGTNSVPKLTKAGVKVVGSSHVQSIELTVPAGVQGPTGPPGTSGPIRSAPDYDDSIGPSSRSVFAFNRQRSTGGAFRPLPSPNGFGPWTLGTADFAPTFPYDATYGGWYMKDDRGTLGSLTLPALPFAYRPMVYGAVRLGADPNTYNLAFVRMDSPTGQIVASGLPIGAGSTVTTAIQVSFTPMFGDPQARGFGPNATYATVPAWEPLTLYVNMERAGGTGWIGFDPPDAMMTVFAMPVGY